MKYSKFELKLNTILLEYKNQHRYTNNTAQKFDLKKAHQEKRLQTGKPIEIPAYRGQRKNEIDIDRGIWYTPELKHAELYASTPQHHIIQKTLKIKNPLVVTGWGKALDYLTEKNALIGTQYEDLCHQLTADKRDCLPLQYRERAIAFGARKLQHDAIILLDMDEICMLNIQ